MDRQLVEMLAQARESERRRVAEQDRVAAMLRELHAVSPDRPGGRVALRAGRMSTILTLRWGHRA